MSRCNTSQPREMLVPSNDPGATDHSGTGRTDHTDVNNVALPVLIVFRGNCLIALSGGSKYLLQFFSMGGRQTQHRFKDARLVPAARVLRTQTVITQLAEVNNGALSIGHPH